MLRKMACFLDSNVLQTLYMVDRLSTSGFESTLRVMLTICRSAATALVFQDQHENALHGTSDLACLPLVPVTELIERGLVRMSMTAGFCNHGTRKCVPSVTALGSTPCILSYITARSPPSTAQKLSDDHAVRMTGTGE